MCPWCLSRARGVVKAAHVTFTARGEAATISMVTRSSRSANTAQRRPLLTHFSRWNSRGTEEESAQEPALPRFDLPGEGTLALQDPWSPSSWVSAGLQSCREASWDGRAEAARELVSVLAQLLPFWSF